MVVLSFLMSLLIKTIEIMMPNGLKMYKKMNLKVYLLEPSFLTNSAGVSIVKGKFDYLLK